MSNSDMQFKKSEWWKALICTLIAIGLIWVALKGAGLAKEKEVKKIHAPIYKTERSPSITEWEKLNWGKIKHLKAGESFAEILTVPNEAKDLIKRHEGIRHTVYLDTEDIPTIGIGFNLLKDGAKERIESLGVSYQDVILTKTSLTDKQIENLFEYDFMNAVGVAGNFLPTFEQQPKNIKIVLVNMAYNLGGVGLGRFTRFRQALLEQDYQKAADEMVDSKWYYQVGNRSKELVKMVREIPAK